MNSVQIRNFRQVCAVAAALLAFTVCNPAQALGVGEQTPVIDLPGNGKNVTVGPLPGKLVYLDFWASWCGTCRQSFPWMNEMQKKYADRGFEVIGVNLDAEQDDASKFLEKVPADFTIAYDRAGDSARAFGVKGMPTSVLIGADGKVLHVHTGFSEDGRKQIEQIIEAALADQQ